MRNLLNFLLKYNNLIVFLILEGLAFYWLASGDSYHNSRVVKGTQGVTRRMEERISNIRSFLNLREVNETLVSENNALRNSLEQLSGRDNLSFISVKDSQFIQQYQFTSARVINNSVNKQKNFFTINKGNRQGIKVDMAVASGQNVAGVVVGCSENFSIAISLLNLDFRLSARFKSNGYFGSLNWDGRNYRHAVLNEIPQHINVVMGDTIETTGYSAIFPEGMLVGTVSDLKKSGSDFYKITIELFTDFRNLEYVGVIGNLKRTEQLGLENQLQ